MAGLLVPYILQYDEPKKLKLISELKPAGRSKTKTGVRENRTIKNDVLEGRISKDLL
jgi:hypothetical protein